MFVLFELGFSFKALKKRRDFEIEGFTNDIVALRKQLKSLERQIMRVEGFEDKEQFLLGIARKTGEKATKISNELHSLKVFSSLPCPKTIRQRCMKQKGKCSLWLSRLITMMKYKYFEHKNKDQLTVFEPNVWNIYYNKELCLCGPLISTLNQKAPINVWSW